MSINDRKERDRIERRELILNTANEIIMTEGIDKLSIRKVAARIEYSPAIIYHYFKDKDDIISHIMARGYEKIIKALSSVEASKSDPKEYIKKLAKKYIEEALKIPQEYANIMLNSSESVLLQTSVLFEGACTKKPGMRIFYDCLKELCEKAEKETIELTTQVIWTATFGLIIRLILEKNLIDAKQRQKLIDFHINTIIDGIICSYQNYNENLM